MAPSAGWRTRIADILLPALCIHCGTVLEISRPALCAGCRVSVNALSAPGCRRCGLPRPGSPEECDRCRRWPTGMAALAATRYGGPAETVVRAIKYRGWNHLTDFCAERMQAALEQRGLCPDVLAPVPLHPVRRRARGYNQAEVLAEALASRVGRPVVRLLTRVRATRPQVGLSRTARSANVAGAFRASQLPAGFGLVGLIDDVATSGATLAAAGTELAAAGATRILAITFALALDGPVR